MDVDNNGKFEASKIFHIDNKEINYCFDSGLLEEREFYDFCDFIKYDIGIQDVILLKYISSKVLIPWNLSNLRMNTMTVEHLEKSVLKEKASSLSELYAVAVEKLVRQLHIGLRVEF